MPEQNNPGSEIFRKRFETFNKLKKEMAPEEWDEFQVRKRITMHGFLSTDLAELFPEQLMELALMTGKKLSGEKDEPITPSGVPGVIHNFIRRPFEGYRLIENGYKTPKGRTRRAYKVKRENAAKDAPEDEATEDEGRKGG